MEIKNKHSFWRYIYINMPMIPNYVNVLINMWSCEICTYFSSKLK